MLISKKKILLSFLVLFAIGVWVFFWLSRPSYSLVNDSDRKMTFSVVSRGKQKDFILVPHEQISVRYARDSFPELITFFAESEEIYKYGREWQARGTVYFRRTDDAWCRAPFPYFREKGSLKRFYLSEAFPISGSVKVEDTIITYHEPPMTSTKGPVSVNVSQLFADSVVRDCHVDFQLGFIVHHPDIENGVGFAFYFKGFGWVGDDFPKDGEGLGTRIEVVYRER